MEKKSESVLKPGSDGIREAENDSEKKILNMETKIKNILMNLKRSEECIEEMLYSINRVERNLINVKAARSTKRLVIA